MKIQLIYLTMLLGLFLSSRSSGEELQWPREIKVKEYTITLYQPQLESFKQNILTGRMALSVIGKDLEMTFGALWFYATLQTDLDERTAVLSRFEVPMIKFPDIENETNLEALKEVVISDLESIDMEMSLDRIIASLEDADTENMLTDNLNNNPPKIYYRNSPSVLIFIDGEPILKKVEGNSAMEYVQNTPYLIVKFKGNYYLKGGEHWYIAPIILTDNWKTTTSVPKEVAQLAKQMVEEEKEPEIDKNEKTIPSVIVTTVPSELITSDGDLQYEPIKNTSLLYVKNSENDIVMDINSQRHFVLLNGRWFSSKTLMDGDWIFVSPEDVPEDFANIPEDASIASVRVSVPGTDEALEAKYEQQMPQTAMVDRKTATVTVEYDGDPKFEAIGGTVVQYAINTPQTVLKINNKFYCVDEGIWFESKSAKGPWVVCDSRPEEVDDIPPSAPVYNVKYVYIYDYTPEVVYVGYTPGYCHSYWYHGVVYYGTGYYYRPWYGYYYYPRPVTFGFGVHYNPYTGWGFSVGVSYGWFTTSFHRPGYGYWGPAGYRHGYRHGYYHGYHHGYQNGYLRGYSSGYANGKYNSRNVYKNRTNGVVRSTTNNRMTNTTRPRSNNQKISARPSNNPNNVYTDRDGNILSRDNKGNWTQENKRPSTRPDLPNKSAQPSARPSTRPSTQPSARPSQPSSTQPSARPSTRPNTMEQQFNNRNRGTTNYNNFQNNRATPSRNVARPVPSRGGIR